jgi:hypothetical protein
LPILFVANLALFTVPFPNNIFDPAWTRYDDGLDPTGRKTFKSQILLIVTMTGAWWV